MGISSSSKSGNSKEHGARRKEQRAKSKEQSDNGLMTAGQSIHDLQSSILTAQYSALSPFH